MKSKGLRIGRKAVYKRNEDLVDNLKTFAVMKKLMKIDNKKNPHRKRNVIVEYKDGDHALMLKPATEQEPFRNLSEIERITIIIDGKELEFVACQ